MHFRTMPVSVTRVPAMFLAVIVISRDFIILLGISVLSIMSIPVKISPTYVSKVTTALQLITVLLALSFRCLPYEVSGIWLLAFYWITALFTIVSGFNYIARGMKLMNHDTKK